MRQNEYVGMLSDGRRFLVVQDHHVPSVPSVFQWIAIDCGTGRQYQAKQYESLGGFEIPELRLKIPVTGPHS